jgi:hypothetical protein
MSKGFFMQSEILTTSDIRSITGWTMGRIQALCRSGKLPAKDISLGAKKARYIIRRCDWEQFITPQSRALQTVTQSRNRIDAKVKDKVL